MKIIIYRSVVIHARTQLGLLEEELTNLGGRRQHPSAVDEYRSSHRQGFVRCAIDLHSPTELGTKFRPPAGGPGLDVLDRFPEFSGVGGDDALVASLWSSNSL